MDLAAKVAREAQLTEVAAEPVMAATAATLTEDLAAQAATAARLMAESVEKEVYSTRQAPQKVEMVVAMA